jgi:hypothetical protein
MTEFWPDGDRISEVYGFLLRLACACFVAWAFLDGWHTAAAIGGAILILLPWALLKPLRQIRLTDDAVVEVKRGRVRELPVDGIVAIETRYVFYRNPEVTIRDRRGSKMEFQSSHDGEAFLLELGRRLQPKSHELHASKAAAQALGWPDSPRWG